MSLSYSNMCSQILEDNFGKGIRLVGDVLMRKGSMPFPRIFHALKEHKMPAAKVKECLKIMIQHNFVTYKMRQGYADPSYTFSAEAVFNILRYPRYFALIETQLGEDTKVVLEEILHVGQISITKLLFILGSKYRKSDPKTMPEESEVRAKLVQYLNAFQSLTKSKFCIRCEALISTDEAAVPQFKPFTSAEEYYVVKPDFNLLCPKIMADSNVKDLEDSDDILWKVNFDTFHLEMKNELLVDAMRRRLLTLGDERVFKIMLQIGLERDAYAVNTPNISVVEITERLKGIPGGPGILRHLDQHLEMMTEDPLRLVVRASDANSGLYMINVKTAFFELMWTTIEEIIIERHGYHAARIFRLVKKNKFVEQDRLNELGMMPGKDAKCLTYKLVEDNFITMKEMRKSYNASSNANAKTAFVFSVEILQVVHTVMEWCYKAMLNARSRLTEEMDKQRNLLSKESRIERILANMKKNKCSEEQFAEVRAVITPPEREVLNSVHNRMNRLNSAILRADHTVFVIKSFLLYHKLKP